MPDWMETAFPPDRQKPICLVPPVKADAVAIRLEHPVNLGECRKHPKRVVVIGYAAPASVVVTHKVRRVGQNQIHAGIRQPSQDLDTIAMCDLIYERSKGTCAADLWGRATLGDRVERQSKAAIHFGASCKFSLYWCQWGAARFCSEPFP
jgi:hypothetical protein